MVAILVITTILVFILIEIALQRKAKRKKAGVPMRPKAVADERFLVPKGYFFSPSHAWVELLFDGTVRIGIDDFLQKLVGRIDEVKIALANSSVRKGQLFFTIRRGDRILSVPSPLSGELIRTNDSLRKAVDQINNDPYEAGWIAEIEPTNLAREIKLLNVAEDATRWLKREVSRLRDFLRRNSVTELPGRPLISTGITQLDGGIPLSSALSSADQDVWDAFGREFLHDSDDQNELS